MPVVGNKAGPPNSRSDTGHCLLILLFIWYVFLFSIDRTLGLGAAVPAFIELWIRGFTTSPKYTTLVRFQGAGGPSLFLIGTMVQVFAWLAPPAIRYVQQTTRHGGYPVPECRSCGQRFHLYLNILYTLFHVFKHEGAQACPVRLSMLTCVCVPLIQRTRFVVTKLYD